MGKVSSAVIDTENVYEDLKVAAKASMVNVSDVDVDILSIRTSYIIDNGNAVVVDNVAIFDDTEFFLNPTLQIEQSYKVRYYDKTVTNKPILPKISIAANKTLTRIRAKVFATENLKYSPDLATEIENAINRELLKYGFLIGIRNANLKIESRHIASIIRVNGGLNEDIVFDVAYGIDAKYPIDDALLYHYRDKNKDDNDPNASVLSIVKEDEVIIEYVKSHPGRNGRNLKGELIPVNEPKNENMADIKTTDKIEKIEDDDGIKYIAKAQGYISEEGGVYDIKEKLEVDAVNLKTTGSIDAGLDNDITINVTEADAMKDAIGAGMKIEASTLNVLGSVAESAHIKTRSVKIGGLTHAKSTIESVDAEIATHLGTLICSNEAKIDRLEGGKVEAKIVHVNSVVGGEITGEEIYINELASNCTITAARLVVINTLRGDNNKIIIDITKIKEFSDSLKTYTEKKQVLSREVYKLTESLKEKKGLINANTTSINYVKQRVEEISRTGADAPISLLNKLKDYQALVYEYNTLAKQYKAKKEHLDEAIAGLEKIQDMIFDSKVVNKGRWLELNDIKFQLIEPKKTIDYVTKENELSKVITIKHLKIAGEDIYEIHKSNILPQEIL